MKCDIGRASSNFTASPYFPFYYKQPLLYNNCFGMWQLYPKVLSNFAWVLPCDPNGIIEVLVMFNTVQR